MSQSGRMIKAAFAVSTLISCLSCNQEDRSEVVVYTSLDRPHSAPIFEAFTKATGITVKAVYDTEASKTVGLFHRLLAERKYPRADVFWNSEVLRTIKLKQEGLLIPYASPDAEGIPKSYKDPEHYWTGFAARARVIFYHKNQISDPPTRIGDLIAEKWKGQVALANPLFGTTNTQFALLTAQEGPKTVIAFCQALKSNDVVIQLGNAQARDAVAAGELPLCITDTDDAWAAIKNGRPVDMIYPDQGVEDSGLLLIPNTVSLIKGGPHPEAGKKLIDFLLSTKVESMLAYSDSAQIPLRPGVDKPPHVKSVKSLKILPTNFEEAALVLKETAEIVETHLLSP